MNLDKGISTPIAILLIIICSAVVGALVWQFAEGPRLESGVNYNAETEESGQKYLSGYLFILDDESKLFASYEDSAYSKVYSENELSDLLNSENTVPSLETTLTRQKARANAQDLEKRNAEVEESSDLNGNYGKGVVYYHWFPYNPDASWQKWYFPVTKNDKLIAVSVVKDKLDSGNIFYNESHINANEFPMLKSSEARQRVKSYIESNNIKANVADEIFVGYSY